MSDRSARHMTERERAELEARKAIAKFVATGEWPKPGILPVCVRFPHAR